MKPISHAKPVNNSSFAIFLREAICVGASLLSLASFAYALDGQVSIHDPSTIIECDGKYYTFGTGGTALVSNDGWTWSTGTRASKTGMAPDLIHIGDRYYQYIASNPGGQPHGQIIMISNKTLNPDSPDYKWEDGGIIAISDGEEFCNAIDPGLFLDPNDGRLWMVYGSYFGYIRLVELDPKNGKRINPNDKPYDIAINCEATIMIYRDGWYYLLGTHGSCCAGTNSSYHIRMGRSRKITGPYIDENGVDMIMGGGKLFMGSYGRYVGPGHFGIIELGGGVEKFSIHWEADLERGGASVVDILPLQWKNGWPVAGENLKAGAYQIESVRTGTALSLDVETVQVGGPRGRGGAGGGARGGAGGGAGAPAGAGTGAAPRGNASGTPGAAPGAGAPAGAGTGTTPRGNATATPGAGAPAGVPAGGGGMGGMFAGTGSVIPDQDVNEVSKNWPAANIAVRMGTYMCQAQEKWNITPVAEAGGKFSPYYKITVAGTNRALAVGNDGELISLPAFTGGPEQLWLIDQLNDGTWRIMPKTVPNSKEPLALSAIGTSFATLSKYDPNSNKQRWNIKNP